MINRKRYVRRKKTQDTGSKGPLMLNIRVRHVRVKGEPKTSTDNVKDALQELLDTGRMPAGWQFMAVNWKNPAKFGTSWSAGWPVYARTEDADEFREAFTAAVQASLRLARVRKL